MPFKNPLTLNNAVRLLALSAAASGLAPRAEGASSSRSGTTGLCIPSELANARGIYDAHTANRQEIFQSNAAIILKIWKETKFSTIPNETAFDKIMLAQAAIACAAEGKDPNAALSAIKYKKQLHGILDKHHFIAVRDFLEHSGYKTIEAFLRDLLSTVAASEILNRDDTIYPKQLLVRPSGQFTNCHDTAFNELGSTNPVHIACAPELFTQPPINPCDLATQNSEQLQHVLFNSPQQAHSALVIPQNMLPKADKSYMLSTDGLGASSSLVPCNYPDFVKQYGPAFNTYHTRAPNEAEQQLFKAFNNLLAVMSDDQQHTEL